MRIKPETKPDRFSKPVRFGVPVSEVIKVSLLSFDDIFFEVRYYD